MTELEKAIRDDEPDELIARIKASHDVKRVVSWPGRPDIKIEIRLLTLSETRKAKVDNQLEFKHDGIDIAMHNVTDYREQEAAHGMWRAFYNVDTGKRIFRSVEHLRSFCTPDELKKLCDEYNAFAEECDAHRNAKKNAGPGSIESRKLEYGLEASAYFGCPVASITDAQWLLVFAMKGLLEPNEKDKGWQTIGE